MGPRDFVFCRDFSMAPALRSVPVDVLAARHRRAQLKVDDLYEDTEESEEDEEALEDVEPAEVWQVAVDAENCAPQQLPSNCCGAYWDRRPSGCRDATRGACFSPYALGCMGSRLWQCLLD